MKRLESITLSDVQAVYSGAERRLWELIMGEQIHIGGFGSSAELAQRAGLAAGQYGIDLCCCTGAGMRFLVRFINVARMIGVDATQAAVDLGLERTRDEGLASRIEFVVAEACKTGLPEGKADFVWGEDAWCYVEDKPALAAEAARIVKSGGTIAFTDWIEGSGLDQGSAERFLRFMKFPSLFSLSDYRAEFERNGCRVVHAANTGRFAPAVDLYLKMLQQQLTYDALKIIGFDSVAAESLMGELAFAAELANAGKIAQGLFVLVKN